MIQRLFSCLVGGYYDNMNINVPLMRIASWAANVGITRFVPGISDSDAVKYGTLSDMEKEIYEAVLHSCQNSDKFPAKNSQVGARALTWPIIILRPGRFWPGRFAFRW